MQETSIGWTDFSANLLKYVNALGKTVWACVHASEGCRFCYSEALAKRRGRGEAFTAEHMKALTPYFDTKEADQVLKSKKIAGKKVFVDDMTDLFGEWVPDEIIIDHFKLFAQRPDVTFQVLTKRAKRVYDLSTAIPGLMDWSHVHIGVSAENQKTFDERWHLLRAADVAVRWVSIEPLIAPVDAQPALYEYLDEWVWPDGIVIGGESGAGHREMPLLEAVALARQFQQAGVAVYVKQDSGPRPGMQGRIPDDVWAMKEWPKAA
jgi:protein gp37